MAPDRADPDTAASRARTSVWDGSLGHAARRSLQLLLVAAAAWIVLQLLLRVTFLMIPLTIALIVASAIWPLATVLRGRMPDALAAITTVLTFLAVVLGLTSLVAGRVYAQWDELRSDATAGLLELERWLTRALPVDVEQGSLLGADALRERLGRYAREEAVAGAVAVGEVLSALLLVLVITFFLLKDGPMFWAWFVRRLEPGMRERAQRAGPRATSVLGAFVRGTAVVAFVDAIVIGVALVILDVPLALSLAILVFLGAFVPLVGAVVSGALAVLVALVTHGPLVAFIVALVVLAVNQLEGDLLAPIVLGNAVDLHPLAILLAVTAGVLVAGVVGAFLAVPLLAVVKTVAESWTQPDRPDG